MDQINQNINNHRKDVNRQRIPQADQHFTTKNKKTNYNTDNHNTDHIWKTRNKLQFNDTIIPATNVIINIKNELKNIILTHYKHHTINNTLHEFRSNFCINNALCRLTQNSITMLL